MFFQPVPYAGGIGGNDTYTVLLLHGDGTDGGTTITESQVGGGSHTASHIGSPTTETEQYKFGTASIYMVGSQSLQWNDHVDWYYYNGDFTIDFWVRWAAFPANYSNFASQSDGTSTNVVWFNHTQYSTLHQLAFTCYVGGGIYHASYADTGGNLSTGTWYHIATERYGNSQNYYLNGTKLTTVVSNAWTGTPTDMNNVFQIGYSYYSATYTNFYIEEYRLSKGIARYQGNSFDPPSQAYS